MINKLIFAVSAVMAISLGSTAATASTPVEDLENFRSYYTKKFPDTPISDYNNGVYSINAGARAQWEAIEEFAPYEIDIEDGEAMWNKPFSNGNTYADCFGGSAAIRTQFPHFDTSKGEVVTLESAINQCRKDNGEKPLKYKKGAIAKLSAYIAYESRGQVFDVKIPNQAALEAYTKGKEFFYKKRGQLNMSCSDCHMQNSGNWARADLLSPALGHMTHFPVYRSKWGEIGTAHRRFGGCNNNIRAKSFKAQSDEYKSLEYFLTYMGNGLKANGPGSRK
ncbi:MAG: sulfur oxidation c-type cytochrome SoxA [Gammaproteobacteria bacterium]|nr:sulfur oxidation c-type cytochrome SoxA [Gammaproteobacteria bacterium]